MDDGFNGAADENGGVVGYGVADPLGEALGQLHHRLAHRCRELQRVRARQLEDRNSDGGLCIEHAAQCVGLRTQLDTSHVTQVHDIAVGAGLDDDVAELGLGLQPAHCVDDVFKIRVG